MFVYIIMELGTSLGLVGKYISDREPVQENRLHLNRIKRGSSNGDSIYQSTNVQNDRRYIKKLTSENYVKSQDTAKTGIVPNYFNAFEEIKKSGKIRQFDEINDKEGFSGNNDNDSVFSDDKSNGSFKSSGSDNDDHMAFFNKGNMIRDNKVHEKKFKTTKANTNGEPSYFSQFSEMKFDNPGEPVSMNNTHHKSGKYADASRLETERDLALKGNYSSFEDKDMTYGVVDQKNFVHNNMVPFIKGKTNTGYGPDSIYEQKVGDVYQRKLDTFTGSINNPEYKKKTERKPLFNPQIGLTWLYGMPNFTDYYETRFTPGRERRNEYLQQPVRITPGLNIAANQVSKQGFHDLFRPLEKTVDELRTADQPKVSYTAPVIPGKKSERRGIIPNVAKRRPTTFKENDPRDMLKSLGVWRAQTVYGNVDAPTTNRQLTTRAHYGAASFNPTIPKPDSLMEKFKFANRENFLNDAPRNITGVDQSKNTSYTEGNYYVEPTARQVYGKNNYVNPAYGEQKKEVAFDYQTNIQDPTLRNITENNTYQGNMGTNQLNKTYVYDYNTNVPDTTIRNTTQNNTYQGNMGTNQLNKTYVYDHNTNIPDPTIRDVTQNNTYQGPANPSYKQTYAYDHQTNIPDPTIRDVTQNNTYQGPMNPSYKQSYAYDHQTNIPDPTIRDVTQNNTYQGPMNPSYKQSYAYDHNTNIPDPTIRDVTQNNTYQGPMNPSYKQSYAYDHNTNIPDPTIRDVTQNNTYQGPMQTEWKQSYAFDHQSNIQDPTIRDVTQNNTYQGPMQTEFKKPYVFDYHSNIQDPTIRDVTQNNTYQGPMNTEFKKPYVFDYQSNIQDPTIRDVTQNNTYQGPANTGYKQTYAFDYQSNIQDPTIRDVTQNNTYQGPANTGYKQTYAFDYQSNIQDPTIRDVTQNNTYQGPANTGYKQTYAFDYQSNVQDPTIRDITQNNTYQGPANTGYKQTYAFDYQSNIQDPTIRDITQNNTYQGPANTDVKKTYAWDYQSNIPDPTIRDLTQNKNYNGPIARHEGFVGGYNAAQSGTVAKPTMRLLTQNKTYQGPLILHEGQKTRSRGDVDNSLVSIGKEVAAIIRDGGAPTTSNYEKTPTYEHTMVQLCEPIQINRELYGYRNGQNPLTCVPVMHTRGPSTLPEESWRFDTCVYDVLKTNPFINNTQHKYVEYCAK